MNLPPATDPQKRRRSRARRWWGGFGCTLALAWGGYLYQPLRYDFIPRRPPQPHPWTDPDRAHLFSPRARVTIINAHPDDSEFYLGGTLPQLARAGTQLSLIVATDGDKGYQPFRDTAAITRTRRREQDAAARQWNAQEVIYLGRRDGRLRHTPELEATLEAHLRRLQPEYVLVLDAEYPPRLTHGDHRVAGTAGAAAARRVESVRWLLHFSTIAPNFAVDVTNEWQRRWELLHVHASEFNGYKRERVHAIITRNAEVDGNKIGTRYAEGLRCVRLR